MANSPYNFITVECYLVAYLSNWVKIVPPHQHGHVDDCKCTIQHVCPFSVESNGCLAVKPKNVKLSYAEMVKVTTAVEMQDRIIGNGGDPTTDLIQVDIKKK